MSFFSSKFKIFMGLVMVFTIALVCILKDNGAADEGVPVADVEDHQQHKQEAGQVKQDVVHIDIVDIVHIVMIVEAGIIILAVYIWTRTTTSLPRCLLLVLTLYWATGLAGSI